MAQLSLRFRAPELERDFAQAYWTETLQWRRRAVLGAFLFLAFLYSVVLWTWMGPAKLHFWEQPVTGWALFVTTVCCLLGLLALEFATERPRATDWATSIYIVANFVVVTGVFDLPPQTLGYPINQGISLEVAHTNLENQAVVFAVVLVLFYGLMLPTVSGHGTPTLLISSLFFAAAAGHDPDPYGLEVLYGVLVLLVALAAVFSIRQRELGRRRLFVQQCINEEQKRNLAAANAESETLLLNVLPGTIAERLKGNEISIADEFADVSILFADIVGFTPMSEQLGPKRMLGVLNELFLKFDEIAERHGVEKIETIGDGYLAAGGAPSALDRHPEAVAQMALDMLAAAGAVQVIEGEFVHLRIGVHTGPVLGGVIGKKRLHYDLFGETVNVASRIESHSVPDRVLVSESTYKRISRHFTLEQNDTIDLKGHGPMRTWWLKGAKRPQTSAEPKDSGAPANGSGS